MPLEDKGCMPRKACQDVHSNRDPAPASLELERNGVTNVRGLSTFRSDLACLHQPRFLRRDPLQQLRRRLVVRVLRHELAAHGQIENEPAQAGNRVGRVGDAFIVGQQASAFIASAPPPGSPSAGRAALAVSLSAAFSLASSSSGSPWSSATVCGFLMSRL